MKILIAEDDRVSCRLLEATLKRWNYEVIVVTDGLAAWDILQRNDAPPLAILDWIMPGLDGLEVCRRVRHLNGMPATFLILLTACGQHEDIVAGLEGGANDYIRKPFNPEELRARLRVGLRMVELQRNQAARVRDLEIALQQVKQLQGLLPICMYCKKIRDVQNYWQQVEHYIGNHSEARFSHGICPTCFESVVEPSLQQ